MLILIDPGDVGLQNLGDVAMLQAAMDRLLALWPFSDLFVLTSNALSLARYCPRARPVSDEARRTWLGDQLLLGRLHARLPEPLRRAASGLTRLLRFAAPALLEARIRLRRGGDRLAAGEMEEFLDVMRRADLLVTAGQGTLNDTFASHARLVLDTVEVAERLHKPTAMLGQGIGPLTSKALSRRASRVLRRVGLLGLREKRVGPELLAAMGVDPGRIRLTGDDAVEMAYAARPERLGSQLGLNLRTGRRSGIDAAMIEGLRGQLLEFIRAKDATIAPLPIALDPSRGDLVAIEHALGERRGATAERNMPESPRAVIRAAAGCRVIVTAAYHAAVFALSQGVPAVCLAGSDYYREKFLGLRDLFGEGCRVVSLDEAGGTESVARVLEDTWVCAEKRRESLLAAAEKQVRNGQDTYRGLKALLGGGGRAA